MIAVIGGPRQEHYRQMFMCRPHIELACFVFDRVRYRAPRAGTHVRHGRILAHGYSRLSYHLGCHGIGWIEADRMPPGCRRVPISEHDRALPPGGRKTSPRMGKAIFSPGALTLRWVRSGRGTLGNADVLLPDDFYPWNLTYL
jgi:hypothetical protein